MEADSPYYPRRYERGEQFVYDREKCEGPIIGAVPCVSALGEMNDDTCPPRGGDPASGENGIEQLLEQCDSRAARVF